MEAAPTPKPATILQKIRLEYPEAQPIKTEEIIKIPAAIMSGSFRPNRSAIKPVMSVPIIHPTYSELPVHPS